MNKDELIKLKHMLDNVQLNRYVVLYNEEYGLYDAGVEYDIFEICKEKNTLNAIEYLIKNIENIIYYLFMNNTPFDSISIYPDFGFFTKIEDYNKEFGTIKNEAEILEDIVQVGFYLSTYSDENKEKEIDFEKISNHMPQFIVSLKELKNELASRGFVLERILNVEDIKNKKHGKLTITFPKSKVQNQKKKNKIKV